MAPTPTDNDAVARQVSTVVRSSFATKLTSAYFNATYGFAGALFDGLDPSGLLSHNPPDEFTADDIAATSLLDVRFGPAAVRTLLADPSTSAALAAVPPHRTLWDATEEDLAAATELWQAVRGVKGVGRTRASKLLARKRPNLIPIVDSVIADALSLRYETWRPLAAVLRDSELRRDIEALRPVSVSNEVSLLRLLDVVTWTTHSRSTAAVRLQRAVGAPTTRELGRIRGET